MSFYYLNPVPSLQAIWTRHIDCQSHVTKSSVDPNAPEKDLKSYYGQKTETVIQSSGTSVIVCDFTFICIVPCLE